MRLFPSLERRATQVFLVSLLVSGVPAPEVPAHEVLAHEVPAYEMPAS